MAHTSTDTGAETPDAGADIFNPFSAPQQGLPGAQPGAGSSPASGKDSASDESADSQNDEPAATPISDPVNVLFQAPDLSAVEPVRVSSPAKNNDRDRDDDSSGSDASANESSNRGTKSRNSRNSGTEAPDDEPASQSSDADGDDSGSQHGKKSRRKRRRGGSRGKSRGDDEQNAQSSGSEDEAENEGSSKADNGSAQDDSASGEDQSSTGPDEDSDQPVVRKRRRRRRGSVDMEVEDDSDDSTHTVTRVRAPREAAESSAPTKVAGVKGSTRLEAKRQRRRASREGGRRRQIITEAEFLARRESVDRKMIVRQRGERIQIGVLEDGVLAEHYVSNTTQDSLIGNVYLGKIQNVLPSMEAAFVDIGRGRNAVLYAGEVDWDSANLDGAPRKIENALKGGDSVLVQVTKDPVGHKGARLTSQVSLPGRYLVFVPGGSMTGISRKLPDTERARLKKILKEHMPEDAGVIVRTAAEGASEEELTNDINRLRSLWETIQKQANDKKVLAPELLYAEPDLTIKVVRDVFNEDFSSMEVQGDETWDNIEAYVTYVAPHLLDRLHKFEAEQQEAEGKATDIFAHHRIDEQLNKALDRKVNLPSGGSLVFDRTEAMTVVDVNTGKFTGSGGNLEETVTKNNLEAAEEIVRQLRLRDIGGIIVIDFIDMVLESNRDLVLRRLVECLGRDRTKHQVAEVTSLGLVQMTRKRMGTGLLEVFSETCEHCNGRGIITHEEPIEHRPAYNSQGEVRNGKGSKKRRRGKGGRNNDEGNGQPENSVEDKEKQEKAEKARQALAKVAAATQAQSSEDSGPDKDGAGSDQADERQESPSSAGAAHQHDDQADAQPSARGSRGSKQRAGRSGRGRGQAQKDPSQNKDGAEKAAVLTIGGEAVEVPRRSQSAAQQPAAEQPSEARLTLDTLNQAVASRSASQDASGQPGTPRGRRRRRAAGSAQGASGEVQQVSAEIVEPAKTFSSASSSAPKSEAKKEPAGASAEPVMFGVGVKAEDISQGETSADEQTAEKR